MFMLAEDELWPVLLRSKCTKPRLANKQASSSTAPTYIKE